MSSTKAVEETYRIMRILGIVIAVSFLVIAYLWSTQEPTNSNMVALIISAWILLSAFVSLTLISFLTSFKGKIVETAEISRTIYISSTSALLIIANWALWITSEFTIWNMLVMLSVYIIYLFWIVNI